MLFGLKNTSSWAYAALNLSIATAVHVLPSLIWACQATRRTGIIGIQFVCIQIVSWVLLLACTAQHWVVLLACTAWHCCAWIGEGGDLKIWTSFQRKDFFLLTNVFFVLFCSKIRSFQLWYHCILTRNLSFCGSNSVGGPFLVAYWFNICAHWYCLTRTLSWSNYVILVLVQHLHFLQHWKRVSFCFEGDYK